MTISARPIAFFADFKVSGALKWIFALAVLAAMVGAPGPADARRARVVGGPGAYDGTWNVTFAPRAGNCSSTNTVPFLVSGRSVASAAPGAATAARTAATKIHGKALNVLKSAKKAVGRADILIFFLTRATPLMASGDASGHGGSSVRRCQSG